MIRRIERMSRPGVLKAFVWKSGVPDFENISLVYGPNGSGKTSLAAALYEAAYSPTSRSDITLAVDGLEGIEVAGSDHSIFDRLYVFSEDFISKNHRLSRDEATMLAIVTIGHRSVEADEEIARLQEEFPTLEADLTALERRAEVAQRDLDNTRSTIADRVVNALSLLQGDFQSRTKFSVRVVEELYNSNEGNWIELDEQSFQTAVTLVGAPPGDVINEPELLDIEVPSDLATRIRKALAETPVIILLDSLGTHPEAETWVHEGLGLHQDSNECIFCGGNLTDKRRREIEAHFSADVERLNAEVKSLILEVQTISINVEKSVDRRPKRTDFAHDLRDASEAIITTYSDSATELLAWLSGQMHRLQTKGITLQHLGIWHRWTIRPASECICSTI
jgi:wobble nucleotide-excising tRNase